MSRPYDEFKDTPLWRTVAEALDELTANRDVTVATAPDYVIGYLCQRLTAARLTSVRASEYDP